MMNQRQILVKTKSIIANLFNVSEEIITLDSKQQEIEMWDSLGHLKLFLALEQNFGVKFTLKEISNANTVRDIVISIEQKYK